MFLANFRVVGPTPATYIKCVEKEDAMKNADASKAYQERLKKVRAHLARIESGLKNHVVKGEQIDWSHVGDLGYLDEKLGEVARFINNEDD